MINENNIFTIIPSKAQFKPSDSISFDIYTEENESSKTIEVLIDYIGKVIYQQEFPLKDSQNIILEERFDAGKGYGVSAKLIDSKGLILSQDFTAFDIHEHWRDAPRYGFLCDFTSKENSDIESVDVFKKYHLNIIQFYDWMYRHDQLVPNQDEYIDPLGRKLSFNVIKEKLNKLHEYGMHGIAYAAIYASLEDFFEKHPEWGLYQNNGIPYTLADIFYIMDISENSSWNDYIISEFQKVINEGFDGLHLDQYGYPKKALLHHTKDKKVVDLSKCFTPFINKTKHLIQNVNSDAGVIFNNVSNFPTYATVDSDQEAIYIEVWSPIKSYRDLKSLIDQTKLISFEKHVILAAYLAPFNPNSENFNQESAENAAYVTMATIFSNGAYHLLIGERENVLTEGYYPNFGYMSDDFKVGIKDYYDFIVHYQDLLFSFDLIDKSLTHTGGYVAEIGRDNEIEFDHPTVTFSPHGEKETIWTIIKENDSFIVIHLINLIGLDHLNWNEQQSSKPITQKGIKIRVLIEESFDNIYCSSPDIRHGEADILSYTKVQGTNGYMVEFEIERLDVWAMVYFTKL